MFGLSDIDVAQSDVNQLSELTAQAAEVLLEDLRQIHRGTNGGWPFRYCRIQKHDCRHLPTTSLPPRTLKDARKKLNLQKAPRRGRTMAIHPDLEGDLFDIPDFVSRDKIADTNRL